MRRIALYSDIHSNLPALNAVLADIQAAGIAERYCLGDLVGYGDDPVGVIARLKEVGDPVIQGNYDAGIGDETGDCGCYYPTPEAKAAGKESYDRTQELIGDAEREFLVDLLPELRFEANGLRVLLCHGSPRRINEYLTPDRSDEFLAKLADEAGADVICSGHVHIPYHRVVLGAGGRAVHYVSDGSVGIPKDGDPRACWAEVCFGTKAEVNPAAPDDRAAGPAGMPEGDRPWVGVVFHRVAF